MSEMAFYEMISELGGFVLLIAGVIVCCIVSGILSDLYSWARSRRKS